MWMRWCVQLCWHTKYSHTRCRSQSIVAIQIGNCALNFVRRQSINDFVCVFEWCRLCRHHFGVILFSNVHTHTHAGWGWGIFFLVVSVAVRIQRNLQTSASMFVLFRMHGMSSLFHASRKHTKCKLSIWNSNNTYSRVRVINENFCCTTDSVLFRFVRLRDRRNTKIVFVMLCARHFKLLLLLPSFSLLVSPLLLLHFRIFCSIRTQPVRLFPFHIVQASFRRTKLTHTTNTPTNGRTQKRNEKKMWSLRTTNIAISFGHMAPVHQSIALEHAWAWERCVCVSVCEPVLQYRSDRLNFGFCAVCRCVWRARSRLRVCVMRDNCRW